MIKRVPHYYDEFTCIASGCKDNCCIGGWEIDIDDETANYYLNLPGEFGDRLRKAIGRTGEYCFKLKDGKCPFLDNHNLCEIYKELGEDKMGVVCTQFPRYTEYFGNIKEMGIGLACEEAERIILTDKKPFLLVSIDIDEEEIEDEEFDSGLSEYLFELRDIIFNMLDNESINLYQKMIYLIAIGHDIQTLINLNDFVKIGHYINDLKTKGLSSVKTKYDNIAAGYSGDVSNIIMAYNELEILNEQWPETINDIFEILYDEDTSKEQYNKVLKEYWTVIKDRDYEYCNMLKYFIFRYFMKAAYDHDVFGKVQLAVTNFFVIRDMDIVRWLKNDKMFDLQDRIDTVHIFSREVEYSEDNLEVLAEEFIFDDIFKAENLIALLKENMILFSDII